MPLTKIEDLADTTLAQKISQLPGVGLVSISGGQKPAVRIQATPRALPPTGLAWKTAHGADQTNVNQAKGNFDGLRSPTPSAPTTRFSPAPATSPSSSPTGMARRCGLQDVATVVDGAENMRQAAWMNSTPAVILNIQRQPGANIIAVVDRIEALLAAACKPRFPCHSTCRFSPTAPPPFAPR